jgi:sec-independent protein translocase protein TatB
MLSLPHLVIVFIVALVVFGPEKLPELARTAGKFMAEFRRMSGEFKSTFEGHMRDLEREADERRRPTPVPTPSYTAPVENTIHGASSSSGDAETAAAVPVATPAQGIVPSADPRIRHAEEPGETSGNGANSNGSGSEASSENGSESVSYEPPPEEPGATAEPVTDGEHFTC